MSRVERNDQGVPKQPSPVGEDQRQQPSRIHSERRPSKAEGEEQDVDQALDRDTTGGGP